MLEQVKEIRDNLNIVNKMLRNAAENKKKFGKDEPIPSNVFYIDTRIEREYNEIQGKPMPIKDIINYYLDWSEQLLELANKNKDNLWNEKVVLHIASCWFACLSIRPTLKNNISQVDWDSIFDSPSEI